MLVILRKPYPIFQNYPVVALRMLLVGGFVSSFLIFFQPFNTANVDFPYKIPFLAGYGGIVSFVFGLFWVGIPLLIPQFFIEEKWTVGKQILHWAIPLTITLLTCYLYLNWFFAYSISLSGFWYFYRLVFPIALIPIIIATLLDYLYKFKHHAEQALALNQSIEQNIDNQEFIINKIENITFQDERQQDRLVLVLDDFYYVKAANNYVEIYFLEEGKMIRKLLRNSIKNIENQVDNTVIRRCHRSYLVNLRQVKKVSGNAQGYQLHLNVSEEVSIPMSRGKGKELVKELKDIFI